MLCILNVQAAELDYWRAALTPLAPRGLIGSQGCLRFYFPTRDLRRFRSLP